MPSSETPQPPHVDYDGYFFSADTIGELAGSQGGFAEHGLARCLVFGLAGRHAATVTAIADGAHDRGP